MQSNSPVSHSKIRDLIKGVRKDCLVSMGVVYEFNSSSVTHLKELEQYRLQSARQQAFSLLQDIRFDLGIVLEYSDTSGENSYIRWKKTFEFQDKIETVEETDTPNSFPHLSGGTAKDFMNLAADLERKEKLLKELMIDLEEYYLSGWIYEHFREAVVNITKVRCYLRLCSALISDEKTDLREKERNEGSSNSILPSDQGFQASARTG